MEVYEQYFILHPWRDPVAPEYAAKPSSKDGGGAGWRWGGSNEPYTPSAPPKKRRSRRQ